MMSHWSSRCVRTSIPDREREREGRGLTSVFLHQPLVCLPKVVVAKEAASCGQRRGVLRVRAFVRAEERICESGCRGFYSCWSRTAGKRTALVRIKCFFCWETGGCQQPPAEGKRGVPHGARVHAPCPSWRLAWPPTRPKQARPPPFPSRLHSPHPPRVCVRHSDRRGRSPCR